MTYILHHEAPARFETQTEVRTALRAARNALGALLQAATRITKTIANIPGAVSRAFATAYIDPFQPSHPANDPADPRNF